MLLRFSLVLQGGPTLQIPIIVLKIGNLQNFFGTVLLLHGMGDFLSSLTIFWAVFLNFLTLILGYYFDLIILIRDITL